MSKLEGMKGHLSWGLKKWNERHWKLEREEREGERMVMWDLGEERVEYILIKLFTVVYSLASLFLENCLPKFIWNRTSHKENYCRLPFLSIQPRRCPLKTTWFVDDNKLTKSLSILLAWILK